MIPNWNYLVTQYRYYNLSNPTKLYNNFKEIVLDTEKSTLDQTAILEYLKWGYILSDRTMIKDIKRTSWLSKPNGEKWEHNLIEEYNINQVTDENKIVNRLISLSLNEVSKFLMNKDSIGILLSGGMDSRICAMFVNELIKRGDFKGNVVGITWGDDNSRDVQYSRKICKLFNWESIVLPINEKVLLENIDIAAEYGAMASPVHLHNMIAVSKIEGLDGILAASYGDSIGRAEYSGRHITNLKPMSKKKLNNKDLLLNRSLVKRSNIEAHYDITNYYYNQNKWNGRTEFDYQAFYMRNKLQWCMDIINEKIPLHQLFTSPEVYQFMFSLKWELRNNQIYEKMLKLMEPQLLEIPWSRTGTIYESTNSKPLDNYKKNFHEYHKWIRNELRAPIKDLILSKEIENTGIFDMDAIDSIYSIYPNHSKDGLNIYDEWFIWVASIAKMLKTYNNNFVVNDLYQESQNPSKFNRLRVKFKYNVLELSQSSKLVVHNLKNKL
jgi:asparagine synthase (glutamine-hydrolysing)